MLRLLGLPHDWAGHDPRGPGQQLFPGLHPIHDTLGPLYPSGNGLLWRNDAVEGFW